MGYYTKTQMKIGKKTNFKMKIKPYYGGVCNKIKVKDVSFVIQHLERSVNEFVNFNVRLEVIANIMGWN